MKTNIDCYISELRHTIDMAGLNHEICWVYKNNDTRSKYVNIMNSYKQFFTTSLHAHFVAMLVALYRLYEGEQKVSKEEREVFSIPSLLRKLKDETKLSDTAIKPIESIYQNEAKPLWEKIRILRNKAFAHRSTAYTVEEWFKEANVTANNFHNLIEVSKKLLNELTLAWDKNSYAFIAGSEEDTLRLLEDLKNAAAARSGIA